MTDDNRRINRERVFWEKGAVNYDRRTLVKDGIMYRELIGLVRAALHPEDRVLDIACGTGTLALEAAEVAAEVTGVDIAPKMVNIASAKSRKRGTANLTVRVGDGCRLDFPEEAFDVVLCCNLLHVLESPERQLGEARRVLKPGGRLITSTDCYAERRSPRAHFQYWGTRAARALGIIPYLHFFYSHDLRRLMEAAGFTIQEERELDYLGITGFYTRAIRI